MTQAEINLFINRAQQKIADLAAKIVTDIDEQNSYVEELELCDDLYGVIECLTDSGNDWSDLFIQSTIECYNKRADLNLYPWDSFLGYTTILGSYSGATGQPGRGIADITITNGYMYITYTDGSVQNAGYVGGNGDSGANIFVTNVEAVNPGKSVNITWKSDTIEQNIVDSVATDDTDLRIYILWDGGKEWNGTMVANGVTTFPNTDRVSSLSRMFTADAAVDVDGLTEVTIAGNGGSTTLPITALAAVPTITTVAFGAYPITRGISQTELKDGDQIRLIITLSNSSNVSSIIVENAGTDGFLAEEIAVTDIGNNQVQCYVTADHAFLTDTSKGIKFRLKTYTGSEGSTYNSTGVAEVIMNNTAPTITFNGITYPATQEALKDSETADVDVTVSDYDEITYSSASAQLSIPNAGTYAQVKTVTRIDGEYNVSTNNYSIVAYRNSNGSQATYSTVVQIAHAAQVINITTPATRLISGGNDSTSPQDHVITVSSSQQLIEDPTLGADIGTLQADMTDNGSMTAFYETLQIHDNDTKGNGTFTISSKNLAGKVVTAINSGGTYVSGGFVLRRKYFAAFTDESIMGVDVVDTSKLNAWDKDLIAMTYVADQLDSVREYTILNDNTIHWNDVTEVENNTTGLSFIEIEEEA